MRKLLQNLIFLLIITLIVLIWQKAPQSSISMTIAILIAVSAITFLHKTPDAELQSAVKKRDASFELIQELVKAGASLKSRDKDGR
ncbi:MAG: hypothetical protein IJG51_07305, partial [Synergistaceae bacterium]|nr:hypothetical protein [Synergistaceae bacterium]